MLFPNNQSFANTYVSNLSYGKAFKGAVICIYYINTRYL